ncbi:hypothetical protein BB558_003618 [Smittium angustum]|uniref:Exportin-1 C-terminal domain-containing protein n=1 Tax=Smittium angustum TaxID=133377 RepID=A0A2U1J5I7_SMIAN|nr:hypothetical protein BB558_003618 [Smittium angustum]
MLLNPTVLQIFYEFYKKSPKSGSQHGGKDQRHLVMQCLIQLSGIKCTSLTVNLPEKEQHLVRVSYSESIIKIIFLLIQECISEKQNQNSENEYFDEDSSHDLIAISELNKQFVDTLLQESLTLDSTKRQIQPIEFLFTFIPHTLDYLKCISKAIEYLLRESLIQLREGVYSTIDDFDESYEVEALSHFLEGWVNLVEAASEWSDSLLQNFGEDNVLTNKANDIINDLNVISTPICNLYIEVYISLSLKDMEIDGKFDVDSELSRDYSQESEFTFIFQVYQVAKLIRLGSYDFLLNLCNLLQSKMQKMEESTHVLVQQLESLSINNNYGTENDPIQDTHKILSCILNICGFVMAEKGETEHILVPNKIMEASIVVSKKLFNDEEEIVSAGSNPEVYAGDLRATESISKAINPQKLRIDPVVNIVHLTLSLLEFIVADGSLSINQSKSLLIQSIYKFFTRIGPVYLLPDENEYEKISPTFIYAFGNAKNDGHGTQILFSLLDNAVKTLKKWQFNEHITMSVVEMLMAFVKSNRLKNEITGNSQYRLFVSTLMTCMDYLHQQARISVVYIVSSLAVNSIHHFKNKDHITDIHELANVYFLNDFISFSDTNLDISATYGVQDAKYLAEKLLYGLDVLEGIYQACHPAIVWDLHFTVTSRVLSIFKGLFLSFYHVEDVMLKLLQLLETIASYQETSWFTEIECPETIVSSYYKTQNQKDVDGNEIEYKTIQSYFLGLGEAMTSYKIGKSKNF